MSKLANQLKEMALTIYNSLSIYHFLVNTKTANRRTEQMVQSFAMVRTNQDERSSSKCIAQFTTEILEKLQFQNYRDVWLNRKHPWS